jgi:carbamate kinase
VNAGDPSYVIALGGNSILRKGERGLVREQYANFERTCRDLLPLLKTDHRVFITHGNGPQIGNLILSLEIAGEKFPLLPLDVCGAMTQGSIGVMLQRILVNCLNQAGVSRPVVTVVTQVVVDALDDAFWKPTKPVGPFSSAEEAETLRWEAGWTLVEDARGGYRRVVASPTPLEIVERATIRSLAQSGAIVICCGGGGIPVIRSGDGTLVPIEGVIDKDLAAAQLALDIGAHWMLILTDVEHVVINMGNPDQRRVGQTTAAEMKAWFDEKQVPNCKHGDQDRGGYPISGGQRP